MSIPGTFVALAFIALALPCALLGQSQSELPAVAQKPPSAVTTPELHRRNPRYRIQPDDVLDLSFRYTPEFNQEAGRIYPVKGFEPRCPG